MNLQVVTFEGRGPSTGAIFARNVARIVDGLPFLYLLGIISISPARLHASASAIGWLGRLSLGLTARVVSDPL